MFNLRSRDGQCHGVGVWMTMGGDCGDDNGQRHFRHGLSGIHLCRCCAGRIVMYQKKRTEGSVVDEIFLMAGPRYLFRFPRKKYQAMPRAMRHEKATPRKMY